MRLARLGHSRSRSISLDQLRWVQDGYKIHVRSDNTVLPHAGLALAGAAPLDLLGAISRKAFAISRRPSPSVQPRGGVCPVAFADARHVSQRLLDQNLTKRDTAEAGDQDERLRAASGFAAALRPYGRG